MAANSIYVAANSVGLETSSYQAKTHAWIENKRKQLFKFVEASSINDMNSLHGILAMKKMDVDCIVDKSKNARTM